MSLPAGIVPFPLTKWENGHQNFKVKLTRDASYNMRPPFGIHGQEDNYHATTRNFQWLIGQAIDRKITLRALGNGWSFSEVAVCSGGLVDTRELRYFFQPPASFVHDSYISGGKTPTDLVFTECGMSILQLHKELESENGWKRSLRASGASNGQTIVGATQTGTHGSGMRAGAVHDAIVGLHVITGPNTHVWIERSSQPVASDAFIQWLGATPVRDDAAFEAAVVSFGSFGFIQGVLLETEPLFLLQKYVQGPMAFDESLQRAVNAWDFSGLQLPMPVDKLYHFEVVVNPHQFSGGKGVFIKTIFKVPYTNNYTPPKDDEKFQYGDELLGVIQSVLDHIGKPLRQALIPPMVNKLFPLAYAAQEEVTGTMGELFSNTKFRGKAASAAMAIDAANAYRAVEEFVALNKSTAFAGALALRFVSGTRATLGFTHFPKTCVLEMDGVESASSRKFFEKMWNRFEALDIPYTLHWGKINFILNAERVRRMYGDAAVDSWIACREQLLTADTRKVFTNAFMQQCGLG